MAISMNFTGMNKGIFQGLPTGIIDNGLLRLEFLLDAGPRIVRLSAFGGENLFAETPNKVETTYGDFYFRGGHRLWHSPEVMPRSYIPDNDGVIVETLKYGVRLSGPAESGTGISKVIEISFSPGSPAVTINHILKNEALWQTELAPWALTMLRVGGTVILPQQVGPVDRDGLLNNRILALWPYSSIKDHRLALGDDFILIHTDKTAQPFKIGCDNPHGWLAYWMDGLLFQKRFEISPGLTYPDGGCNCESYCNDQFVELESLGPLTRLDPGGSIRLTETWELFQGSDVAFLPQQIRGQLTWRG